MGVYGSEHSAAVPLPFTYPAQVPVSCILLAAVNQHGFVPLVLAVLANIVAIEGLHRIAHRRIYSTATRFNPLEPYI